MTNNSLYRNVPKRNRQNPNKSIQLNNQIPKEETSDAPDYLPYSVYSNLEQLKQKAQEDIIHPIQNSHSASPKQPSLKPRKRHSRPLKLTGEVNLGTNKFSNRERKQKQKQKERERPVEEPVNTIEETVTNAGRHHHHNLPNEIETSSTYVPTESSVFETTQSSIEKTTKSEEKKKLDEKAHRRERLKQKLSALTPEERQAFLLMKHQRSEAKKKGLIVTN